MHPICSRLIDYHITSGYWESANDMRYGYILSPEPFPLNVHLQRQLSEIGEAIANYQRGIRKLYELIETNRGRKSDLIRTLFRQSCDGLPLICNEKPFPLCKVDLIIDNENNLKIVEIDAYNPRAIPFVSFFKDVFYEFSSNFYLGVEKILAKQVAMKDSNTIVWPYSNRERYYSRGIMQLKRILFNNCGIRLQTFNAIEHLSAHNLPSMILIIPTGLHTPAEVLTKEKLIERYYQNESDFIFPLHPWAATKSMLAIISNDTHDSETDELLRAANLNLDLLRHYIPKSILVGKYQERVIHQWMNRRTDFILKKSFSSGHKGVFYNDSSEFPSVFNEAIALKRPSYILQETINQKAFTLPFFEPMGTIRKDQWYVRLTAHIDENGAIVDAEITGRRHPCVYGALDSIQIPCTI